MSLGANFSSSQTDKLGNEAIRCGVRTSTYSKSCCLNNSGYEPVAKYPSMVIKKYSCPQPTPAALALFPKVAVPSSVRTQKLIDCQVQAFFPDPNQRFAQFNRYKIPLPCPPLTQLAASAGISKPSTRECNIYPNT